MSDTEEMDPHELHQFGLELQKLIEHNERVATARLHTIPTITDDKITGVPSESVPLQSVPSGSVPSYNATGSYSKCYMILIHLLLLCCIVGVGYLLIRQSDHGSCTCFNSQQVGDNDTLISNLSGIWKESSGKHWRITMIGSFYSLDGLDFGANNWKAAGVFNNESKALTTWWENGEEGESIIVTIYDADTLHLSNGDVFRRVKN